MAPRSARHLFAVLVLATLLMALLVVTGVLPPSNLRATPVPISQVPWTAALLGLAAGAWYLWVETRDPNRFLARNLARAKREIDGGRLQLEAPADPNVNGSDVRALTSGVHPALLLSLLALALAPLGAAGFLTSLGCGDPWRTWWSALAVELLVLVGVGAWLHGRKYVVSQGHVLSLE